MAPSLLATVYNSLGLGNVLLLFLLLFLLHYMKVLYEFRNMPPGPRLTTLPVLGNIFSIDSKAEKLTDAFQRLVVKYSRSRSSQSRIFKGDGNWLFEIDT